MVLAILRCHDHTIQAFQIAETHVFILTDCFTCANPCRTCTKWGIIPASKLICGAWGPEISSRNGTQESSPDLTGETFGKWYQESKLI